MAVVAVVLGAAAIGGLIAGMVAWLLPNFDPAAPHASAGAVVKEARKEAAAHPGLGAYVRSRMDPTNLTGLALTIALGMLAGGAIAVGALLVMVQHDAGLARYDLSAARWGGDHATSGSTRVLRDISMLGGTYVMIAVAIVAAVTQYRRTRTTAVITFLAIVVVGQTIAANVTKLLVDRARPDIHQLTHFSGSSFPSGHSATAAATFAAIALLVGRGRSRRTKAFLAAGAAAIAVAVASTRVLLGVHWFTDVIAGLALGWAWFAIASIAFGGRVLRFGQPVEVAQAVAEVVAEEERTPVGAARRGPQPASSAS